MIHCTHTVWRDLSWFAWRQDISGSSTTRVLSISGLITTSANTYFTNLDNFPRFETFHVISFFFCTNKTISSFKFHVRSKISQRISHIFSVWPNCKGIPVSFTATLSRLLSGIVWLPWHFRFVNDEFLKHFRTTQHFRNADSQ